MSFLRELKGIKRKSTFLDRMYTFMSLKKVVCNTVFFEKIWRYKAKIDISRPIKLKRMLSRLYSMWILLKFHLDV